MSNSSNILALDVGEARIGVARASSIAKIPEALPTIPVNDQTMRAIQNIVSEHGADMVVIGLPRNMSGEVTAQTAKVQAFADSLKQAIGLPVVFQDESLTSVKAEQALALQKKAYNKEDVDALAATYILEDYLSTLGQ